MCTIAFMHVSTETTYRKSKVDTTNPMDPSNGIDGAQIIKSPNPNSIALHVGIDSILKDPFSGFAELFTHIPGWDKPNKQCITVERISGAMTNLVFKAHNSESTHNSTVIIRTFGHGNALFSRRREHGIFLAASQLHIGPQCLVEYENGRVEEFLPGTPLTAISMRKPNIAAAIARSLHHFHTKMYTQLALIHEYTSIDGCSSNVDDSGDVDALWERLSGWLDTVFRLAPEKAKQLGLHDQTTAQEEVDRIQQEIQDRWGKSWLVMSHNDLQYGNILVSPAHDVTLIDYEYSTIGDVAFDIANHFCEYAADYHITDEKEMLNWDRLPTAEERRHFCEAYCHEALNSKGRLCTVLTEAASAIDNSLTDGSNNHTLSLVSIVAKMLEDKAVSMMRLSHLQWGLWGLIQYKASDSMGFDYLGYARKRIEQYHLTK